MTIQVSQFRSFVRPLLILFAVSASFQACKGENSEPDDGDDVVNPGGDRNDDGSGGRKASGGSGNSSGGKSSNTGGGRTSSGGAAGDSPGGETSSGGVPEGSGGGFVEPPREDCPEEPNGDECWDLSECNGVDSIQFLEQCSGNCVFGPFDNANIEGFDGTLPPLT